MSYVSQGNEKILKAFFPKGDYQVATTPRSRRVFNDAVSLVFSLHPMGQGRVAICGMVKAHVRKRVQSGEMLRRPFRPASYWRIGPTLDGEWTEAMELDISAAYLSAAVKVGAISQKIHDWLYTKHKRTRLVALGSLASKKTVETFHRGKLVAGKTEIIEDSDCKYAWDRIVAEVDQTMRKISETVKRTDFLFYWVDAVMVRRAAAPVVRQALMDAGYTSKEFEVTIRKRKNYIIMGDGRCFTLPTVGVAAPGIHIVEG